MQFSQPGQIVFEPDGKNGPLLLFANPPEATPPDKNDPNVKYFGPGLHRADAIQLTDNQTLYLAPGAVVQGGIHARGTNITIRGRGILDGYTRIRDSRGRRATRCCSRTAATSRSRALSSRTAGAGPSCRGGCDGVRIENMKLLWRALRTATALTPSIRGMSRSPTVSCAPTTTALTPKGMGRELAGFYGDSGVRHAIAERPRDCPWKTCSWRTASSGATAPMSGGIGCESQRRGLSQSSLPQHRRRCTFPISGLRTKCRSASAWSPREDMVQENILFEDIRIRTAGQRGLIDLRPKVTQWARQPVPGRIQNVVFRNVSFTGPAGKAPGRIRVSGPGPNHSVANVRFENVTRNGEALTATAAGVELLGFVDGISFHGRHREGTRGPTSAPAAEARRHAPIVLIEARQARGVIAVQGGADGPFKAAVARLQDGLKRATGTTLPVVEEAKPGPAVILGDSPQAAAEGLKSDQIASRRIRNPDPQGTRLDCRRCRRRAARRGRLSRQRAHYVPRGFDRNRHRSGRRADGAQRTT